MTATSPPNFNTHKEIYMSRKLTPEQARIVKEMCDLHGLDETQISFDGTELTPIFDYEAVCSLSLKLTDIPSIDCWISDHGSAEDEMVTAKCKVTVPDGRSRTCEANAQLLEKLPDGGIVETFQMAQAVARARAVRLGIRSVGVNLYNAHRKFVETGEIALGHTRHDPRLPAYNEIHVLAEKCDLIVDADRRNYEAFISEMFPGKTSAADLDDLQLRQLLVSLRAMAGRTGQRAA